VSDSTLDCDGLEAALFDDPLFDVDEDEEPVPTLIAEAGVGALCV
jgi:hypothetical protein